MNNLLKTLKIVVRLCPLFLVTLPTQATTADDTTATDTTATAATADDTTATDTTTDTTATDTTATDTTADDTTATDTTADDTTATDTTATAATADDTTATAATADDTTATAATAYPCDIFVKGKAVTSLRYLDWVSFSEALLKIPVEIHKDWLAVRSVTIEEVELFFRILSGTLELTNIIHDKIKREPFLWCAKHYGVDMHLIRQIHPEIETFFAAGEDAGAAEAPKLSEWGAVLENPETHCTRLGQLSGHLDRRECYSPYMVDVRFVKDGIPTSQRLVAAVFYPINNVSLNDQYHRKIEQYKRLAASTSSRLVEVLYEVPPIQDDGLIIYMSPWKNTLALCSGKEKLDNPTKLQMILDILTGISRLHTASQFDEEDLFDGSLNPDEICLYSPADDPDQQGLVPGAKYRARIANSFVNTLDVLSYIIVANLPSPHYTAPDYYGLEDEDFETPEYILAQKRCDVFSVCVLIYEILTGQALFPPELSAAQVRRMSMDESWHDEYLKKKLIPCSWPKDLQRLISRGLHPYPYVRPCIQELLNYFTVNLDYFIEKGF
ncbi:MAG: hypothetical protein LBR89_04080 [Holosporales bacterium]|jgi:hypothetical protein|nr:hypothetical protein [Holosporales bacterium]